MRAFSFFRIRKIFFLLVVAFAIFCSNVHAQNFICTTNTDGSLNIIGVTGGASGALSIPGSILANGVNVPVTSIGNFAFFASGLTSITIPNSVTSIGYNAFYDSASLTSVKLGNGLTSIGGTAFSGCASLASIMIPNSVTSIGGGAFNGCTKLISIFFIGNAPSADSTVFANDNNATIYYLLDTSGWDSTFEGLPTAGISNSKFSWLQNNFTSAQLGNPSIVGDAAEPAGDGIPNLLKYAFNLPALVNGQASLPQPTAGNGNLVLTFQAFQSDLIYTVEASTDLINWSMTGVTVQTNGSQETASYPLPTNGSAFLRVVVAPGP
jgi:hypothetical protein